MLIPRPRTVRSRRVHLFLAALSLTLAAGSTVLAATTPMASAAPGPGSVVGAQSGRCVDVPNGSTTNGTQVQLYDCTGAAAQTWTYTSARQFT
ncbi:RICIN domain-containing protein, partial [Micromonospora sp. NBS 11-29]|uniref:RICIN domain-containing protein n=1 Tax=Micromonospora sp. NBS 11-29 TaxID=1960879 RepID=UPI0020CE682E